MKRALSLVTLLKRLDGALLRVDDAASAEARRADTVARMMAVRAEIRRGGGKTGLKAPFWAALVAAVVFAAAAVLFVGKGLERAGATATVAVSDGVRVRALAGLVEVEHGKQTALVGADTLPITPDDRVRTRAGALASVFLPSGATFSVSEETSLQVKREAWREAVELGAGRIDVHVPKLEKGASFVVRTADTTVTVRGTRFSVGVRLSPDASFVTQVDVSEGVVAVESRGKLVELRRGEQWSSSARPAAAEASMPVTAVPSSVLEAPARKAAPGQPPSTLGSENELLAQALAAVASHDDARALPLLDGFLAKHGRSPLAENAALERLRILARQKSPAAARAARQYLTRYPHGVGRDLARRLATEDTGPKSETP